MKRRHCLNEIRLISDITEIGGFSIWCDKGWLKAGLIKKLGGELRQDSRFQGQPGRFYTSAVSHVEDIYKSFLQQQRQLRFRLKGQERWLQMLKSDRELAQAADVSLDDIRRVAKDILNVYSTEAEETENLSQNLFSAYDTAQDVLIQKTTYF